MKLASIFALFILSMMVKGNLIAVAQPVLLTLGTIFAAMANQDAYDMQPIQWSNLLHFAKKRPGGKEKKDKLSEE